MLVMRWLAGTEGVVVVGCAEDAALECEPDQFVRTEDRTKVAEGTIRCKVGAESAEEELRGSLVYIDRLIAALEGVRDRTCFEA